MLRIVLKGKLYEAPIGKNPQVISPFNVTRGIL